MQFGCVLLFGVLTVIATQIQIPFRPVPFTGQVLVVLLAGLLLGPRLGAASQLTYLAIGLMGAPVFAGGKFGPAVLLGPTAGYLLAYPLAAAVVGVLSRRAASVVGAGLASAVGALLILLCGGLWLGLGAAYFVPDEVKGAGLVYGLTYGALPFLGVDLLKSACATLIGWPLVKGSR